MQKAHTERFMRVNHHKSTALIMYTTVLQIEQPTDLECGGRNS